MAKGMRTAQSVLLVTADAALASYIDSILNKGLGIRIVHVQSFAEARTGFAQGGFSAVLADLPDVSVEELGFWKTEVPVLLLATEEARPAARRAVEEGVALLYMIRDGLSPDTLIGAVMDAVERPGTLW
ncbi:hypothetical protein ACVNS2_01360 [Paenibacillus caseinilyticus]|uniref:Response regulatory domain-containing protein n=1 Tax=Paenibacillus mucilaginosus K02 TaxID=997761 RepID=I0BAF8_9BACL|nr:hypothetical protein [Paenibacillus mucilaginosus]AFH59355.1 hypothetical protein B2K_01200 [Paenibacillus mucilaginosus K02]